LGIRIRGAVNDLQRFVDAQERGRPSFADALAELHRGRKTSHWIWYVFPQLRGLGRSPLADSYGLDGVDEAEAYVRDPVLGPRLLAAAEAARSHLEPAGGPATSIEELMGSAIDARKLVSCMTLFAPLARAANHADPRPFLTALAAVAEAILRRALAEGYVPCAFTSARLDARPR